ncbi:MAG: sorting protein [Massilia sp.]|jgi:hypothetical protein|nr:sorting protein [Massilia sp.]MDB5793332.1 sorting protein [Massilia sp.]
MFNLKNLFTRALLALMLVTGAGAALAGPTYHVTIDTAGYTGTGTIDFTLFGYESSPDATAFLSNFTGDFGSESELINASGSIATGVLLGPRDFSWFAQTLNLGQTFGFDLRFDVGQAGDPVGFSVGLYSDTLGHYLGEIGTLVAIELTPGQPDLVFADAGLAIVSEVPEPATLASLALGLALMGSTLRARRRG